MWDTNGSNLSVLSKMIRDPGYEMCTMVTTHFRLFRTIYGGPRSPNAGMPAHGVAGPPRKEEEK